MSRLQTVGQTMENDLSPPATRIMSNGPALDLFRVSQRLKRAGNSPKTSPAMRRRGMKLGQEHEGDDFDGTVTIPIQKYSFVAHFIVDAINLNASEQSLIPIQNK